MIFTWLAKYPVWRPEGSKIIRKRKKGEIWPFPASALDGASKVKYSSRRALNINLETHTILQTSVKEFLRQEPEFLKQK